MGDKENSQSFGNALNEERTESELQADKASALNIMHDKRVFRGNTHGMNLLNANMTAA